MFDFYKVGGAVRDSLLDPPVKSKDIDYTVVAQDYPAGADALDVYWAMNEYLRLMDFDIFLESPEFFTTRARFPKRMNMPRGEDCADFVLARKEGPYSDGRHPDWVKPGTLEDDLSRRDFTCNALAIAVEKEQGIIDMFGGVQHTKWRLLLCVGSAEERFQEDALRALRAIRFRVTKGFHWDAPQDVGKGGIARAMKSDWLPPLLSSVSAERKREELEKCFKVSTKETLQILQNECSEAFFDAIFEGKLRLKPTMED